MCLRLIAGLSLILHVSKINGVLTGASRPVLACHIPLEVKIFADSSYQALSADLKSCTQIVLSSVNALFLPSSDTSLASILVSEKRSLELLKQQTPEAEFSFSLRSTQTSPATCNLKTIFNRTTSVAHLVEFLRAYKLKSFDIAWDLIQSAPDYGPQLKSLKATLGKEGFNLTTTIGVEVDRIDAFHVTKIASIVDRIFLTSSYNRHYSGNQYPLTEKKVQQAFDALEHNEGAFLKLYSTLNLSWKKIVVGLSLQTLAWKLSLGTIVGTQFNQYQAILQLQSYYESCKTVNSTWRLHQQPNPFYQLAVAPANDQWMIHIDPLTLGKRVDLLRQYRFGGVALYDYYQDDFAGICSSKGKFYPLIQHAGQSIRNSSLAVPFPDVDINNGLCIPFLGLTNECKGAFNYGTPKISINLVEFNKTSTSSTIAVTRTTLPVVNDAITTRVSSQYTTESVTIPSSSTTEATDVLGPPWALMSDDDNLIRTRRSSLSSGNGLGTEPSYSYLKPPGLDLFDITPRISSSISKLELPALKSQTTATVSPNVVTKASNVKVELSHNNQTHSSGSVSTTLSPTPQLPETGGNQAAFQESQLSTTDIGSLKSLPLKSEILTAVESGSAFPATSLPELEVTENEQAVTHLQNVIESDEPVTPLSLSTSEIDRTMDFLIVSTVPSLKGIDSSSLRTMETMINFDPQDEATIDVTTYVSDTGEDMTDFVDRISAENPTVDVTVSPVENYTLTTAEQPASVFADNAPAEVESDLKNVSTTRVLTLTEQESMASSQYSDSVSDPLEQTTSDVSSLSNGDHLESSTMVPVSSDAFDLTGTKYEAPLLQDFALATNQSTDDDETASSYSEMSSSELDWSTIKQPEETFESPLTFSSNLSSMQTSSSEISIETPVTTLSPQAIFSSTATKTFTEDSPVSDVYSAVSLLPFDLIDAPTSTEEQGGRLDLNSASSSPNEETESPLNRDFSRPYDSSLLEVDTQVHSENDTSSENSFPVVTSSVLEWHTAEETVGSETHVLHSTVFDPSPVEDQVVTETDYPGTLFDNQLAAVEEGSAESSLASSVFLPTLAPFVPPSLMDVVSTSLIPDLGGMSTGLFSKATPIEETLFSTHIDSSTAETPTLLDVTIAAIELADSDFTASNKNSLFSKPQFETTLMSTITDSNKIQFIEPSEEDSSDESAVPYSTASTDDEMTDILTGNEAKSLMSSLQTDEETVSDKFVPTTSQTSTETSLPTSQSDEVPSTLESLSPFTVTDTSSTFLKQIIIEASTEWQHFESSPTNLKMDIEESQWLNDLSTPYSSTLLDTTDTDRYPSSSDTNLSLEIGDSEVTSPAPDWNSDEVSTQSEFLPSASTDVEMTEGPAVNKDDVSVVSTTTYLDEQLAMSELSSVRLETSTDIHFSPSVSDESHPTFEPTLPPNLEGDLVTSMEDTKPTNVIDLSTSNLAILPDITIANTNLMDEENELISFTTSSLHWEDSQSNLPMENAVSSHIPCALDEIDNLDTTHLMEISELTESVPTSSPEARSHSTVKKNSNSLFVFFEQTPNPVESNPSSLMSESPNSGLISTDPSLLYSTPANEEMSTNSEGYTGEVSTSLSLMSSDEQLTAVDLSPSDAGTIPEGSNSMSDEFSGTSELPFDLADTLTFSNISMEHPTLLTSHLNFLSEKPVTFLEDTQTSTMEELSSSLLPLLPQSTTSGTMLVDNEDDPFLSTTSHHLEDSQLKVPIDETFSTLIPFSWVVTWKESLIPLGKNPLVPMTDSPSSTLFESLGTSQGLSKDFTSFEPSLSTANPPISGEFQLLDTVTEELLNLNQTAIFDNEGSGGNALLSLDNDRNGSPAILIVTDHPFETSSIPITSVTVNPINLFSSSLTDELLEYVGDPFTNDVAFSLSMETTGTSESSIINEVFSTDETFETSSPNAASAELILDTTTFPSTLSRPSTPRPIIDMGTVYLVPITDDDIVAGSGDQLWDNTLSEDDSVSLTVSLEDTISTDPLLPYTLVNMDVVSSSEGYNGEISITSDATSSEEQFPIGKFSPNVEMTSTGGSSTFDEFSGTSELPFDVADTTAFFNPTELSTSHLNFISGNSVTFSGDTPTLTEDELTSSSSPILGEISTSVFELTDEKENRISHTTSLVLEDSHPTVPPEEIFFSPIPFDISVSSSGFERTLIPLQMKGDQSYPLEWVGASGGLSEDMASLSPSTAEPEPTGFTTADDEEVVVSTMAPTFENEGSAENWIVLPEEDGSGATPGFLNGTAKPSQNENSIIIQEEDGSGTTPGFLNATAKPNPNENWVVILDEDGSGAITPGFLNATDQPSQTTVSTSEIELTISGVHLSPSSPATSIAVTYETGTVTSSIENTSFRGFSDNFTGQELVKDSFETTTIGFSGTMDLSSVPGSSTEMSIALTSPSTTDISTTGNPSSTTHLPINLTGSAESESTFDITTSLPPLPPNAPAVSSPDPNFDIVTVSYKPPSAYNMMASSTKTWYFTPTESSSSLVSSGSSKDLLSLLPTSTTEISTSVNSVPATSETLLTSSVLTVELSMPSSSAATYSLMLPLFPSSTLMRSTTSPDAVPLSSMSSASPTSISKKISDIPVSTTVSPIINLWNLLMSRITTADGILSSTKNSTSGSLLADGTTSGLIDGELKGRSTSSMSSTTANSENSAFVTRPFWLATRPSLNSSTVFFPGQALLQETTPTPVVIFRTTSRNTKVPVRTSTMASSNQSVADLFATRPVWLQGNMTPSKLTSNVSTSSRLPTTTISSTEGKDSIIVTYSHKPSKSNELSVLHSFTSESTTTLLPSNSIQLDLPTNVNPIVNGYPYVMNCTDHVKPPSFVSSMPNVVTNDDVVHLNVTAGMGDKKQNFSFHLEKLSEALNLLVASYPDIKEEEIQPSVICKAARDSILLKSLFCLNQSPSAMKDKRFPNVIQLIRYLAPEIIANLTSAMNLEVKDSVNVTEFDIGHSSTTTSTTELTIPMSTERSTRSTILAQHSTESFLLNLSTILLSNVSMSPLPTVLNISLESLMENLAEQLKDTQLSDVISAVNRLSHDVPTGFLESLIQNNSLNVVYFSETVRVEDVKEEMITTEEHTSTSSTTAPTTQVHDVLQMDFWKTNRRNPVKMLQRKARTGVGSLPTVGRYWRNTTKSISNIFRPFAKPAIGRS